jgi:hypothetical protein
MNATQAPDAGTIKTNRGHVVETDPALSNGAYDVCTHCGQAIHPAAWGPPSLVTMTGNNPECYGPRP